MRDRVKKTKITYPDGTIYTGDLKEEFYHGRGTIEWKNGAKYSGYWAFGKKNGKGEYKYPDGTIYVGEWKKNKYAGYGILRWTNNSSYEGEFLNNKFHGKGTLKWVSNVQYLDIHSVKIFKNAEEKNGNFSWSGEFAFGNPIIK